MISASQEDNAMDFCLREPQEHALEAAPSLLNPIDWFFDAGDQRLTVRIELGVSSREVAVHDLAVNKAALQVSSDQIHAAYSAPLTRGVGEERTRRGVAKGRRPSLVEVDARLQRVALHAESRLG